MNIIKVEPPMFYIAGTDTILNEYELHLLQRNIQQGVVVIQQPLEIGSLNHQYNNVTGIDSARSYAKNFMVLDQRGRIGSVLKGFNLRNSINNGEYSLEHNITAPARNNPQPAPTAQRANRWTAGTILNFGTAGVVNDPTPVDLNQIMFDEPAR